MDDRFQSPGILQLTQTLADLTDKIALATNELQSWLDDQPDDGGDDER